MHLIQKHRFDKPSESGDQDYNKSVSTPVKLVKQRPNEELNRAKKQPPLFLIQHVSEAKLSKDNEKKRMGRSKDFSWSCNELFKTSNPASRKSFTDL